MSTPVSQLPPTAAPPSNVRHDEDQIVADVLSELQNERRPPPPQQQGPPSQHHVANIQQYTLPSAPPSQFYNEQQQRQQQDGELIFGVIKKDVATRVAVASIAAFLIFYPESLSDIYSKIPTIGEHLNNYDKIVRAILLAVLLYVLLLKFEV